MDPLLMAFIVVVILLVGGFASLTPFFRRLPDQIDRWLELHSSAEPDSDELRRLANDVREIQKRLETMEDRVGILAERQDFTERLLERGDDRGTRRN